MDVKFQTRYNESAKKPAPKQFERALKLANDSLVMHNFELEELNEQLQNLQTEKNILLSNKLIKGESPRDTLPMFKDGIEFLRQRLANINAESVILKKKIYFKNAAIATLQNRINEMRTVDQSGEAEGVLAINTIVVMAYAEAPTAATVSVSFFEANAAWLPTYDLRANSNGTVELNYKAELKQNSGMNWNNVSLILSTGNPSQNTQKPELSPFYLSFIRKVKRKMETYSNDHKMPETKGSVLNGATNTSKADMDDSYTLADYTAEVEGMIQTEYEIKIKYTIPNDDNLHVVAIQNKTLKAKYNYAVIPKLDMGAYLLAEISDWSEMNLVPGTSRIYFDGSYIGKSSINPDASVDTLQLSLGKDRSILVSRKKLKDKTREKVIIDEKVITVTYEIYIRNNKSIAVSLDVNDQIPLSNDPTIKVELLKSDGANYNAETGMLEWKLDLKAKENKKLQFTYEVKIPKDKSLAGL